MAKQEIAERRLCRPVGRLDIDRLAIGMFSLGGALLPVVGFAKAHVTVGIARVTRAALPHLQNEQVREFATMMVADHSAASTELQTIATQKGVMLPTAKPSPSKWNKADKDYDSDYIGKMVKDHEDAVELFTKASRKSDDPALQSFAAKTLPALQGHLEKAKAIKRALK